MKQKYLLLAGLLLAGFMVLIYHTHFDNPFQFDDSHTIVNNLYIRDISNIPLFFKDAETFSSLPANQSYRPIVSTTLAIDYWMGGSLEPFYFHLSMFVLFLVQGFLMFFLFNNILSKVSDSPWIKWISFFITGWYLVHTVNAETINYVISRSDSISTLLIVASLLVYSNNGLGKKYFLYLIPLFLGILTKPTAVMLIPILGLYILYFEAGLSLPNIFGLFRSPKKVEHVAHIVVTTILCAIGYLFVDKMTPDTWVPGGTSMWDYLMTQPYVMLHYFKMFFLPTELTADTDWEVLGSLSDPRFFKGVLFVVTMLGIAILTSIKKEHRPISFGIFWFFIALIPTSSIIPLAEVMNDHRMFFPFVGLVLSVGWIIFLLLDKFVLPKATQFTYIALTAGMLFIFGAYGYGTYQRCEVWNSKESLWKDVTEKSPNNGRGWMNYGLALMEQARYPEALKAYQEALKLTPNYSYLQINMGILLNAMGKTQEPEAYFKRAQQLNPNLPEAHYFYALYLSKQQRLQEAKAELLWTLQLAPAHQQARYLLMGIYAQQNDNKALRALAEETLTIIPNDPQTLAYLNGMKSDDDVVATAQKNVDANPSSESYIELSLAYYNTGNYQACIDACYKALELNPNLAGAYNNICSSYNSMKQWDKAIEACNKALEISPSYELAKNNLNWAKSQVK